MKWNIALDHILRRVVPVQRSVLSPSPQPEARPQAYSRAGAGSAGRTSPKGQHRD